MTAATPGGPSTGSEAIAAHRLYPQADDGRIDLATALKLLSLPRSLGANPADGQAVMAYNGRFGPYVKSGEETRSLPADVSPLDVTLEQALALLAPMLKPSKFLAWANTRGVAKAVQASARMVFFMGDKFGWLAAQAMKSAVRAGFATRLPRR